MSELSRKVAALEDKLKKDNLHEAYKAEMKDLDDKHAELTALIRNAGHSRYLNEEDATALEKAYALRESVIKQKKATNKKAREMGLDVPEIRSDFS